MVGADAASILASTASDSDKYAQILDQDVCQHWYVSSCAFLGGNIKGNTQFGRVGTATMTYIPMMPDGTLDPAFNPVTGVLIPIAGPDYVVTCSFKHCSCPAPNA